MHPTDISLPVQITLTGVSRKPEHYDLPLEAGLYLKRMMRNMLREFAQRESRADSVPAEKLFPVLADTTMRPAAMLKGYRLRANLTQKELAAQLGIKQHHLSEMESGKRNISKDMAKRLADALKCDWKNLV